MYDIDSDLLSLTLQRNREHSGWDWTSELLTDKGYVLLLWWNGFGFLHTLEANTCFDSCATYQYHVRSNPCVGKNAYAALVVYMLYIHT